MNDSYVNGTFEYHFRTIVSLMNEKWGFKGRLNDIHDVRNAIDEIDTAFWERAWWPSG
jgi:hypothetical protein